MKRLVYGLERLLLDLVVVGKRCWRRKGLFRVGLVISLTMVFLGVFGPYIAPYPEEGWGIVTEEARERGILPPSIPFIFGTDHLGRDMLSRILVGARLALIQIVIVIAASLAIGLAIGVTAGYLRGAVEKALTYITELFLAFPPILLAAALIALIGRGLQTVLIALILSWWAWYARLAYLQTREVRELDFVLLAEHFGLPKVYIVVKHIIPNILTPLIVQAITDAGSVILEIATINFLIGAVSTSIEYPDWGMLIGFGMRYIGSYWWMSFFPGLFILVTALGFVLVGDSLYEEMHPKLRRRWRLWF